MLLKFYQSILFPIAVAVVYVIIMGVGIYLVDFHTRDQLQQLLIKWLPWNLRLNFFLIMIALIISWKGIVQAFAVLSERKPDQETGSGGALAISQFLRNHAQLFMLIGLLVMAWLLVAEVAPRVHRIYYDEDIYGNIGQTIAMTGKTGMCNYGTFEYGEYFTHWLVYNKEPSGWPFLMSMVFQLFNVNETYGFVLNNMLYVGSTLICFWIVMLVTNRFFPAFLAALVFAAIPHNVIWSNTMAAEPAAVFFGGLAVLCLINYLKTKKLIHMFWLCLVIPVTSQMRPESAMIILWMFFAVLALSPKIITRREVWAMGLLALFLMLPHILHMYAVSGEPWGAQGPKFSFEYFLKNIKVNGFYYFENQSFPVMFTLLAFVGLCGKVRGFRSRDFVMPWLILLWFIMFWGIFLFFYAGSYKYGADVRFALVSFMPLAILIGIGADRLSGWLQTLLAPKYADRPGGLILIPTLLVFILVFSWMSFLPLIRLVGQEAWGARYDHDYARTFIKKIPSRSVVLTHIPTMMLLWQQGAIQTFAGINNPDLIADLLKRYQGNVYFHRNYWCNTGDQHKGLCQSIADKYDLEEVVSAYEQGNKYGLYRIRGFRPQPSPPVANP